MKEVVDFRSDGSEKAIQANSKQFIKYVHNFAYLTNILDLLIGEGMGRKYRSNNTKRSVPAL